MPLLPDPTNEDVAVVLVGALNPAIFQPAWLAAQKLISEGEAREAKVNIISPQAADITFLDFGLQVLQNRLTLRTIDISKAAKISDLIVGLLTSLPHTPITASGVNHSLHVPVGTEKVCHKIGDLLAPKEPVWESLYEKPGMLSVSIQSVRSGENPFHINVTVQPSGLIPYGMYVGSNFEFKATREVGSAFEVIEFIRTNWDEATKEARRVAERIFEKIVWSQS
jgi:hypothetical protein